LQVELKKFSPFPKTQLWENGVHCFYGFRFFDVYFLQESIDMDFSRSGFAVILCLGMALGACSKASTPSNQEENPQSEDVKTEEEVAQGNTEEVQIPSGSDSGGGSLLLAKEPEFLGGSVLTGNVFLKGSEHVVNFKDSPVGGIVYECAVTLRGVALSATATWQDCSSGFVPKLANGAALADGHYEVHARAKFAASGAPSAVVKKSFYVNSSLNNAKLCKPLDDSQKESLFKFAKSYLVPEKFEGETDFVPPSLTFGFSDGTKIPVTTLRRSVELNADKTMAIMSRNFVSRKYDDCKAIRFRAPISARNSHATHAIFSGSGACVFVDLNADSGEVFFKGAFSKEFCFSGRNAPSRFSMKGLVGEKHTDGSTITSGENVKNGVIGFED
jgi:hypothetical protein